jgi:MoaA/NifB/PqqE/SkfB family radical SAM enzyme
MNHRPKFYRGWKLIELAGRTAINFYTIHKSNSKPIDFKESIESFKVSLKLRKMLYLSKVIKFNSKYYSTPAIPIYPSSAFNKMLMNGGLNYLQAGTDRKQHIDTALLAITSKCKLSCTHCYEFHNLNNDHSISAEKWLEIIKFLQKKGVGIIVLTGGEPLLEFKKTLEILQKADKRKSDFHIHTSGNVLNREMVRKLKEAGLSAAAVGLDDVSRERFDNIRGNGAFENAIQALRLFNEEGIFTYVNLCATKSFIHSGDIWKYFDLVKSLNVSIIQLLEPRPNGAYFHKDIDDLITETERKILKDFMIIGNTSKKYKDYPLVYYLAHIEGANQMGCMMGGLSHFYIDSKGNVNPCVFLPVSFGNILENDFDVIYERMRKVIPTPVHSECPSLLLSSVLNTKHKNGNNIPLKYDEIKNEWDELYNQDTRVSVLGVK